MMTILSLDFRPYLHRRISVIKLISKSFKFVLILLWLWGKKVRIICFMFYGLLRPFYNHFLEDSKRLAGKIQKYSKKKYLSHSHAEHALSHIQPE